MATKKDLVEAHAFARRRLVTAFLSGAPGGREVEPTRPGRTIVGGVALAVLMVAGAAILSVLSPRTPGDWNEPGLVISKETGERYVITEKGDPPDLRPVINVTSAQLILGIDVEPKIVSRDDLDDVTPGTDIGILGAPQELPMTDDFVDTGWTACTGPGMGLKVHIESTPLVDALPDGGFLVRTGEDYWVIARGVPEDDALADPRAYRYRLSPVGEEQDNLLAALGLPHRQNALAVPREWLELFPEGGVLGMESFPIEGRGEPATGAGLPPGARVGDYLTVGPTTFVLTREGPARLDPFDAVVYTNSGVGRGAAQPSGIPVDREPPGGQVNSPSDAATWPDTVPLVQPRDQFCAVLDVAAGEAPAVQIGTAPTGEASAAEVEEGRREATIQAGRGAFVRSGDWHSTTSSTTFVVDDKGAAYPLEGDDTLANLGYASYPAPLVPDSWIKILDPGVLLSTALALCPPEGLVAGEAPCGG